MSAPVTIILPYPPSANRLWRNVGGKTLKSAAYRKWLAEAVAACRAFHRGPAIAGRYRLSIVADRPDNRRRDIDNLFKPISDALVAGGVVVDDCNAKGVAADWSDLVVRGGQICARVEVAA